MKHIFYFLLLSIVFSCKGKDENLDLKYEVINKLILEDRNYHQMVKEDLGINDSTNYFVINHNFSVLDENDWKVYSDSIRNVEPKIKIVKEPDDSIVLQSDSIFSKKDIEYFKQQMDENKGFKIDKNKISSPEKIISQNELEQILTHWRNYKGKQYVNISVPLFNLKKDKCIIKAESCGINPPGCGGRVTVLQKKNGKWVELRNIYNWVN